MKIKSTIKLVRALVAAVITFGSLAEGAVIFKEMVII